MPHVIGVDIGSKFVKIMQLVLKGGRPSITKFAMYEINPDANISAQLSQFFKDAELKGKRIATAISGKNVFVRYMNVPAKTDHEIKAVVKYEIGKHIPLEPVEVVYDCQRLSGTLCHDIPEGETKVVLVAVKKSFLNEHIAMIESTGAILDIIDIDSFALLNAYELCTEELSPGKITAIINIGASKTVLNIFCDGFSFFTRELYKAGNDLTMMISKRLGVNYTKAELMKRDPSKFDEIEPYVVEAVDDIANDIRFSLEFFEDQYDKSINEVVIVGGETRNPRVVSCIAEAIKKTVKHINPLETIRSDLDAKSYETLRQNLAHSFVALGLASRSLM